jgi:hypothetical protein
MRFLLVCLLLTGCASHMQGGASCPSELPAWALSDPLALHDIVIDARTRKFPEESCEEGSRCATCDRYMVAAIFRLTELRTPEAAKLAASLVLNDQLGWNAGDALTLAHAVTRLGADLLPYLKPHTSKSSLAARIVGCIERGEPCN